MSSLLGADSARVRIGSSASGRFVRQAATDGGPHLADPLSRMTPSGRLLYSEPGGKQRVSAARDAAGGSRRGAAIATENPSLRVLSVLRGVVPPAVAAGQSAERSSGPQSALMASAAGAAASPILQRPTARLSARRSGV